MAHMIVSRMPVSRMPESRMPVWLGVLLGLSSAVAWGKEPARTPGETEVRQAREAAAAGNFAKAGALLAKAVAVSVKGRSLHGEEQAAEAFDEIFDKLDSDAAAAPQSGPHAGRPQARALAAAVLGGLDAKRHGVYVSAHALAASLLLEAVAVGDDAHLIEGAAALAAFAGTPKAGVAAAAFARLAEGVVAARAGDAAKALAALAEAAAAFEGRGWIVPALYARLELALLQLGASDTVGAGETLREVTARVTEIVHVDDLQAWVLAVEERAKAAPAELLAAFRAATQPLLRPSDGMAGGRGGNGASGDGGDVSPVGRMWPKWPTGKPFASVKRTGSGFEIDLLFDPAAATVLALRNAQRTWEDGGVTLLLAGPTVALRMVDLAGLRSQPGERSRASRAWAFYWLAEGETWAVAKDGVQITGQAATLTPR